jgi:D-psicose/D-tagatose/L-ribulose 3-epimerase
MGFDVIEVACEDPDSIDASALKARLSAHKLSVIVCGVFGPDRDLSSVEADTRENAKEYLRWCIDTAYEIGSPIVVGPMYASGGKPHPGTKAQITAERERSIEAMKELAGYASDSGIKLALEVINRFETHMINTAQQALDYLAEVASPNVGLHLDTFHMNIEEKDSAAAVRLAADHLLHFHASENDRGVPGTGQVHWKDVFAALKDIHYDGSVVIEAFTPNIRSIEKAASLWRPVAPDQDTIARDGLAFLRTLV